MVTYELSVREEFFLRLWGFWDGEQFVFETQISAVEDV